MRHHPPHLRSLALPPLLLLLLPSARGWSYTIEDAADVVCTGGAGFSKYGGEESTAASLPCLPPLMPLTSCCGPRRGAESAQRQPAGSRGLLELPAGDARGRTHPQRLAGLSLRRRACTFPPPSPLPPPPPTAASFAQGYGCTPEACDNPTVMELWAVNDKGAAQPDTPLWKSQPLNEHSGDQGHWKEEGYSPAVAVSAECGQCVGQYLDFKWLNNGHNVQILLPITVSIDVVPWGAPPTPPFGP
eukprot:COSAG04_NODE_7189_length_1171_cov_2.134328_1_plen_244_part_10